MKKIFQGASNWFGGLSPLVRNIIVLGLFILFFIIVISIVSSIKKSGKKKKEEKEFNNDIKNLTLQGQKPSYPETTYKNLADKIFGATRGFAFGLGTDEQTIKDSFKEMKNELDLVLLEKAFGTKEPADCWAFCDSLGLAEFLSYEMSESDISDINKILESKNINIRF